jgi:CHAT domain-containing protein/Flp pilus assembly protein TadD
MHWKLFILAALVSCFEFAASARAQTPRQELEAAFQQGLALHKKGKYAEAIPHFEKAAGLAVKVFGPEDLNTAALLRTLGTTCRAAGRNRDAEAHLRRSLEIREAKLGKNHIEVADLLNDLALVQQNLGRGKEAEALYLRALQTFANVLPKDDPGLVGPLNNLATLYQAMAQHEKAEPLLLRCLRLAEAHRGKDSPHLISLLNNTSLLFLDMGRLAEGEALARRSLKIIEANLPKEETRLPTILNTLALLVHARGEHAEAEALFKRSVEIHERRFGKMYPGLAAPLGNLARLCGNLGRYADAELYFRRALEIDERVLGKDHPDYATQLSNLGAMYTEMGRGAEAEALYRRSLQILEAKFGKDHPHVAVDLNNLAMVFQKRGQFKDAEALFLRSLFIQEKRFGKDHLEVSRGLNNLGLLYSVMGRRDDAAPLLKRSLQIAEKKLGKVHHSMAIGLSNLGGLYCRMGRYEDAESSLRSALEIAEVKPGKEHPLVAHILLYLAATCQATERPREALEFQQRSLHVSQANLRHVFGYTSEAAMYAYVQTMSGMLPGLITMAAAAPSEAAAESAFTWTLRRKGIVFDSLLRFRQVQHLLAPDDALAQRVSRYRGLKQHIANAAVTPPRGLTAEQLGKQVAEWRKEADDLEMELNRALAEKQPALLDNSDKVTVAAVRKRLPAGSALVEFVRAQVRDFKKLTWQAPRYYAFVLTSEAKAPVLVDLGNAKDLEAGVRAVRQEFLDFQEKLRDCETKEEAQALEKTEEKSFKKAAAALHARLLAPLQKHMAKAKVIFVAPDGELNRLPFESLVDADGKYLIESHRLAYISSGRDLLRAPVKPASGTLVFAGPDFKLDAAARRAQADKILQGRKSPAQEPAPEGDKAAIRGGVRGIGWKPLPGAAAEAKDIQQLLKDGNYGPVRTFVGVEALEEVLKALPAPRVLHLATHGFFLDHEPKPPDDEEGGGAGGARGRLKQADNPLLRSGIVLAGANTVGDKDAKTPGDDGWVTAEEIALLNLRGTELVVLSACQTGLGDVKTGEGVFGLRRAFLFAGARTLVTSLFEVPDLETRDLMKRFYSALQAGQGKLAALHAAQSEMIAQRRRSHAAAHPFYWASFVLVGDPE